MTEERKTEVREWADTKNESQLNDSLGMAINFEWWERAAIIRDSAAKRNIVLIPTDWDNYIDKKIKSVLKNK